MLNIYFSEMSKAIYNMSVYFNNTYKDSWITEPLTKDIIKAVDNSDVIDEKTILSPIFGNMSPWILKIAKDRKVVINLHHLMDFGPEPFKAKILNTNKIVKNMTDLVYEAGEFVEVPMIGIQRVKVSNRDADFKFELHRNITIVRGKSGTGKTTLYDMIADHTRLKDNSGVNISCAKDCVALVDIDWKREFRPVYSDSQETARHNDMIIRSVLTKIFQRSQSPFAKLHFIKDNQRFFSYDGLACDMR